MPFFTISKQCIKHVEGYVGKRLMVMDVPAKRRKAEAEADGQHQERPDREESNQCIFNTSVRYSY